MNKRNPPKSPRTKVSRPQGRGGRWRNYALMLVCGLMLVSGFFFAGRQHFSSMDTGMKNSRLRRQVDDLEAEKRRLLLAREISLSPAEIKRAAKKTGMIDPAAIEAELAQVAPAAPATMEKASQPADALVKPLVIKTAAVSEVAPRATVAYAKTEKAEKPIKKQTSAE